MRHTVAEGVRLACVEGSGDRRARRMVDGVAREMVVSRLHLVAIVLVGRALVRAVGANSFLGPIAWQLSSEGSLVAIVVGAVGGLGVEDLIDAVVS